MQHLSGESQQSTAVSLLVLTTMNGNFILASWAAFSASDITVEIGLLLLRAIRFLNATNYHGTHIHIYWAAVKLALLCDSARIPNLDNQSQFSIGWMPLLSLSGLCWSTNRTKHSAVLCDFVAPPMTDLWPPTSVICGVIKLKFHGTDTDTDFRDAPIV